jgi:hypothetical protein
MSEYPRAPPRHVNFAITRDDKTYTGSYTVEKGLVTVTGFGGTKTTQIGGANPKQLAEMLLSELVAEHEAKVNPNL